VRNPQQHPPTRVGEKRTRGAYAHLSIAAKVAIGESASKNGNEFCISLSKDHPEVWGLGKPLPPSTVSDLKKNLPALRQEYEDGKPKRARGKHPRDVPDELVQAVVEYANEEGKSFGRTTTTAVSQKFAELGSGRKVSPKFLWNLRQKEAFSLMKQHPLGSLELDNEVELEAAVRAMWQYNHVLCVDHGVLPHNTIFVDEKPVVQEKHDDQLIWRLRGSGPAFVRTHGKDKVRFTVILPFTASGFKFSLTVLFPGPNQLRVKVLEGYPVLVIFTPTAMMNSDAFQFMLERAIFPNRPPESKDTDLRAVWYDNHGSHISENTQAWFHNQPNLVGGELPPGTTKYAQPSPHRARHIAHAISRERTPDGTSPMPLTGMSVLRTRTPTAPLNTTSTK
jgi:hypothetical protein